MTALFARLRAWYNRGSLTRVGRMTITLFVAAVVFGALSMCVFSGAWQQ